MAAGAGGASTASSTSPAVWGPFAGWLKTMKGEPIAIQPVNLWEDVVPMEYELAAGVRKTRREARNTCSTSRSKHPRPRSRRSSPTTACRWSQCSTCLVQGNLPAHGAYIKPQRDRIQIEARGGFARSGRHRSKARGLARGRRRPHAGAFQRCPCQLAGAHQVPRQKGRRHQRAAIRKAMRRCTLRRASAIPSSSQLFADLKADLNLPDGDGMTPLQHAVMRNHVPTVKMLLERGADIEKPNKEGYSPLALAIAEAKFEVAKVLLDAGAHIDTTAGPDALTPLMIAASQVSPGEGAIFFPAARGRSISRASSCKRAPTSTRSRSRASPR